MKAHIVLAHPEPQSFNGQLADISRTSLSSDSASATLSDLYATGFDPCEGGHHYTSRKNPDVFHAQTEQRHHADAHNLPDDVQQEMNRILGCDVLIVHFPLWWFGPPAMLKGWMDRVFAYGRMYGSTMRYDAGLCVGKKMIACVTTGASADSCAYNGREGDTYMHLWPVLFPFHYLGFDVLEPVVFHGVGGVSFIENHEDGLSPLDSFKTQWAGALQALTSRSRVPYNRDTDFDETKRLKAAAPAYSPFIRQTKDAL